MKKWKCTICNYIHMGDEPPEICPVCGADKSVFIEVTDEEENGLSESSTPENNKVEASSSPAKETDAAAPVKKWKCTICDYIHVGEEPPDECPICGADKSAFIEVVDENESDIEPVDRPSETVKAETSTPLQHKADDKPSTDKPFGLLGSMVMKFHLHAISVHTPNGVIPVAVVFLLASIYFHYATLEFASFFNLVFVLITMPAVILTGIISWQIKYRGAKTWVFKIKLACSFIVTILLSLMVFWRFIDPDISFSEGTAALVYPVIGLITLAAAGIAGHLGGKLVHGK